MPRSNPDIASIIDNLRRLYQLANEQSKKAEKTAGMTEAQFLALKTIAEQPAVRISDIARRLYLHPATVVGIIDRLEARNLVIRRRSSEDRRVVTVSLTRKGRGLANSAPAAVHGLLVTGLMKLPGLRKEEIADALKRLADILAYGIRGRA